MKTKLFCLIIISIFIFGGCAGHKDQWDSYYNAVGKQIKQQPESQPLVKIEWTDDGQRMKSFTMGNPYEQKTKIVTPAPHPIYGLGIAVLQSPVLSIVGGGYAAKMLADSVGNSAGNRYTNSNNQGSYNETGGGHVAMGSIDASQNHSVNDSNNTPTTTTTTNTDSYNQAYQDSYNQDHSNHDSGWTDDNSAVDSYWNDNKDNRQNYDNPIDNRQNYENAQPNYQDQYSGQFDYTPSEIVYPVIPEVEVIE